MNISRSEIDHLINSLGARLVAFAVGCDERTELPNWAPSGAQPIQAQQRRLIAMREVLEEVEGSEGPDTARAWFMGSNCDNGTKSPAELILEDRFHEVKVSARQMMSDSFS